MTKIVCSILLFVCLSQCATAQKMNFANNSFKIIYAGLVNELSFGLKDTNEIQIPLLVEVSRGEMIRKGNKYYYFTFESGEVCFRLVDIITDKIVDSLNINVIDVDDYQFLIYPRGHLRNTQHYQLDSVAVSSEYLSLLGNIDYYVSKFCIDVIRDKKTVHQFQIYNGAVSKEVSDSLGHIVKCRDKLEFHSFEVNLSGYKIKTSQTLLDVMVCDDEK